MARNYRAILQSDLKRRLSSLSLRSLWLGLRELGFVAFQFANFERARPKLWVMGFGIFVGKAIEQGQPFGLRRTCKVFRAFALNRFTGQPQYDHCDRISGHFRPASGLNTDDASI